MGCCRVLTDEASNPYWNRVSSLFFFFFLCKTRPGPINWGPARFLKQKKKRGEDRDERKTPVRSLPYPRSVEGLDSSPLEPYKGPSSPLRCRHHRDPPEKERERVCLMFYRLEELLFSYCKEGEKTKSCCTLSIVVCTQWWEEGERRRERESRFGKCLTSQCVRGLLY